MRGQFHETRWLEAKAGSVAVPAFGLVKIIGADWEDPGRTVLLVDRPEVDNDFPCAICSHKPIASGDYGLVTCEGPIWVKYDTGETPAVGQQWGAAANSFLLTKGKSGFIILGGVDATREIVLAEPWPSLGLRGGCLDEDHPGRGVAFNIHLGTWSSAQDKWIYDTENTVKAIDWRYGVPFPDEGATGLFEPRLSDTWGVIWEVVSMDCTSPGPCSS